MQLFSIFIFVLLSTVKNIRRFYGKMTGNQLPVHVPLFLRDLVKMILHCKTV